VVVVDEAASDEEGVEAIPEEVVEVVEVADSNVMKVLQQKLLVSSYCCVYFIPILFIVSSFIHH
jgi:hypothetical protein